MISEDSYGNGPIQRPIAFLRGSVRSGNSGGPLVDPAAGCWPPSSPPPPPAPAGGFAIPDEIVRAALADTATAVDTGPCTG